MAYYNKLSTGSAAFSQMMNGFGVVTVMNAKIYEIDSTYDFAQHTAEQIRTAYLGKANKLLATLDTLKVANVTVEGPNKTVTGGQFSNPLIKFGKSARLEMQDALGNAKAVEAFGGAINEYEESTYENVKVMHITEDFAPARLIIGDSFFIDRTTGQQVDVNIIFYQVLPDSIFNLSQDAEGDATVFDMNADLLTTKIKMNDSNNTVHGVFYSILPATTVANYVVNPATLAVTKDSTAVTTGIQYSEDGGATWSSTKPTITVGNTYGVAVVEKGVRLFEDFVVAVAA